MAGMPAMVDFDIGAGFLDRWRGIQAGCKVRKVRPQISPAPAKGHVISRYRVGPVQHMRIRSPYARVCLLPYSIHDRNVEWMLQGDEDKTLDRSLVKSEPGWCLGVN